MSNEFNVDEQYGSGTGNYIKASDLNNRRIAVTISNVRMEANFDKTGKQIVLDFANHPKCFGLNKTNAQMIKNLFNEPDARKWIGKTISLRPDKTQNQQGVLVDCIRVDFELPEQLPFTPQNVPQQAAMAQNQYAQAQNQPVNYGQQQFGQQQPMAQQPFNPNQNQQLPPINTDPIPF